MPKPHFHHEEWKVISHKCKPANIPLNNQNFTEKNQISFYTLYNMAISSVEVYLHLSVFAFVFEQDPRFNPQNYKIIKK